MKLIVFLCMIFFSLSGKGQRLHADFYAGMVNYTGDMKGKAGLAGGIGLSYDLVPKFNLRGVVSYGRLQGDDKNNSSGKGTELRNLNFKSSIIEGQIAIEYNLFDLSVRSFTPYIFAGGAVYHYNPYSSDSTGKKVFLQPLGTEGQGLSQYPDKKLYKLTQFAIPFGGGVKLALSDKLHVGFELGLRKLFNDYLDDVSTTYADSTILASERGPVSVAFAYRGDELTGGALYPKEGAQRGNPTKKDWYYMAGLKVSYRLGSGKDQRKKSKTGCPVFDD